MFQRMKQLYRLSPLVKKGRPISQPLQVPQISGTPGWIFLTHDKDGVAHAMFSDASGDRQENLPVVMDERVCCDTIFRTVRLSPRLFVIYDIVALNGTRIFETLNFESRQQRIADMLEMFHHPDLCAFIPVDKLPVGVIIRGYEQYDCFPGTLGVFVEHNPDV